MKRLLLASIIALSSVNFAEAKNAEYIDKIIKLYNLKTGGALEYNVTKSGDGYDLSMTTNNKFYKDFFSKKAMHISVDDGPIVTTPTFTLATAGLEANGLVLDIFNAKISQDMKKSLKSEPKYKYEAILSFGNELKETTTIDPIKIDIKDATIDISKMSIKNKFDLDTYTGDSTFKVGNIVIKPKKEEGILNARDISLITKVTQEPVKNIMLFANTSLKVGNLNFKANSKRQGKIDIKFSANITGGTTRVDTKFLDFNVAYNFKALDAKTIALAKGIKDSSLKFELKNLGINGVVDFIKLTRKLEKVNSQLVEATSKNDDIAMQKAILKQQEILNSTTDIFNKTFIGDKSRVVLNLNLKSDKESFAKLDLLYKGKPISGNMQSAMISLFAQQLNLFDGDFEIQLDSQLASSINPFAIMGLDLLKNKGFATVKNGIYHLKGSLKGGKIVINGKAYTIKELSGTLF